MPDNLTPQQRSYCMSRIKGKDTSLERILRSELHQRGFRFKKHVRDLPGKPDIVFVKAKVAVFVDGDFWHGWQFSRWQHKLSPFWVSKISKTRERDRINFARLRRRGWKVIRIWEHELKMDLHKVVSCVIETVSDAAKL